MELKHHILDSQGRIINGSNRTFMELKLRIIASISILNISSNRTFMELKHNIQTSTKSSTSVLIAPLWN